MQKLESPSLNICIATQDFIQFVYSFEPILAPKRHIYKYFDYIKQLKSFQGSKSVKTTPKCRGRTNVSIKSGFEVFV